MTSNFPKPPPTPEWASRAPGRMPEFKIHKKKQDAYAAANYRYPNRSTYIYKWNADLEDWDLVDSFELKTKCDLCSNGDLRPYQLSILRSDRRKPRHERRMVCKDCWTDDAARESAELREREERKEYERLKLKYET